MKHTGPSFYDDPTLFATYMERRQRSESANKLLEKPIFDKLVGDVKHLRVLDLGCGDAMYGRELLLRGAKSYTGLDGSQNMVEQARQNLADTAGVVLHGTIEELAMASESCDLIVSRLVLHYVEDLAAIFRQAHQLLAPNGRLVFVVEHPVITSCNDSLEESARRGSWLVDDYFVSGAREVNWLGGTVIKYHRTVEQYFLLLQQAGFQVDALRESKPRRELFAAEEEWARRSRIPLFLFLAAHKA